MKLFLNVNNLYIYIMSDSISEILSNVSSESSQEGGANIGTTELALMISCCTICFTIVVLSCVIHNKNNC